MSGCSRQLLAAAVLIYQLLVTVQCTQSEETRDCGPWRIWNKRTEQCDCVQDLGKLVQCTPNFTQLLYGFCMTHDAEKTETRVGRCPYQIPHNLYNESVHGAYVQLPANTSNLNRFMCGQLNRRGQLCGRCRNHFGSGTLAYSLSCQECRGVYQGWAWYFLLELTPVTIFFLLVIVLHIRVASPSMNAIVAMSQVVVAIYMYQPPIGSYPLGQSSEVWIKVILFAYGIWNLDFFKVLLPSLCVSPHMTTMHTLALQYVPVLYILSLTALTWACIELHGRNVRAIVRLWQPFHRCCTRFRRSWNPKASIIDAFATFLLVSYSRVMLTSLNILYPIRIYHSKKDQGVFTLSKYYCMYDSNNEYFSSEHLPFAVIAVAFLFFFNLVPLLVLTFYPLKCIQRGISRVCPTLQGSKIKAILDAFQGCYRDRYRCFAGLYLILRVSLFLSHMTSTSSSWWVSWLIPALILLATSHVVTILRPYKQNRFNFVDGLIFSLFAVLSTLQTIITLLLGSESSRVLAVIEHILLLLPIGYLVVYFSAKHIFCRLCKSKARSGLTPGELDSLVFPDRVLRPQRYQPAGPPLIGGSASERERGEKESLLGGMASQEYGSFS